MAMTRQTAQVIKKVIERCLADEDIAKEVTKQIQDQKTSAGKESSQPNSSSKNQAISSLMPLKKTPIWGHF